MGAWMTGMFLMFFSFWGEDLSCPAHELSIEMMEESFHGSQEK
jgi:hypothetical protein